MNTPSTASSGDTEKKKLRGSRVLLICPPFQNPTFSSISVALLATYLRGYGIPCEEAYLNLDFCDLLGKERYDNITTSLEGRWRGPTAELLFAEAIHDGLRDPGMADALTALIGAGDERRALLAAFAKTVEERIRYERPGLVGITTSFNQLMAALWMTRIIKAINPEIRVVLGGTACEAPMGERIAAGYPAVDYVVSGFGERPLLALARGDRPASRVIESGAPVPLADLPLPDYHRYLRAFSLNFPEDEARLMFQTSRGCWWGEKRHCTFCGLNGEKMGYTALPSDRVLADIRTLWETHRCNLVATDSILAREHLKEVVPGLSRFADRPVVFYEMKANLSEEDVAAMAAGRVIAQAGIESLSSHLLKLLRKGLTALRALALLKWGRERNAYIAWNQLCGIPGETLDDYEQQISLMARIPHFQPPSRVLPVVIDRYSPYFNDYRGFGWRAIAPVAAYRAAHPHLDEDALLGIAHHFDGEGGVSTNTYLDRFEAAVDAWQQRNEQGDGLFWNRYDGLVRVTDTMAEPLPVSQTAGHVIETTHRISPVKRVMAETGCDAALLDELVEHGILYIERDNALNLTVRTDRR